MTERPLVSICIVTYNSAEDLPKCLATVAKLRYRPLEILVADCASDDDSASVVEADCPVDISTQVFRLPSNLGFAGGMNHLLRLSQAPLILSLNADAHPAADYLELLIERMDSQPDLQVGAVTGRLLRFERRQGDHLLDACGMKLTTSWRHLDRGSDEPDRGQWREADRAFGATGACSLFRREALDDVVIDDEYFLAEFHSFREDAELCYRLRERRWEVLYEPEATAFHRRNSTPGRRRKLSNQINYHSLKNRYLLRAYHQRWPNVLLTLIPTLGRDLAALAYVLLRERSSLAAYSWLWHHRRKIWRRRRQIQQRRLTSEWEMSRWHLRRSLPLDRN